MRTIADQTVPRRFARPMAGQKTFVLSQLKLRLLLGLPLLCGSLLRAAPLGTAFSYQGRLQDGTNAANGLYDLRFAIYDAAGGGTQFGPTLTNSAVGVTNGLFTVLLDFGTNVFGGQARWLESAVRANGVGAFSFLPPREPLTAAPYALYASQAASASNVANAAVSATSLNTPLIPAPGQVLSYNGSSLTWMTLSASNAPSWLLSGNAGTAPGTHFLGTTDNQPLELKVNGQRALRIEPGVNNLPNLVGGAPVNAVDAGVFGAVIGGGGEPAWPNQVSSDYGTIAGGKGNRIAGGGQNSTVSGGALNSIEQNTLDSIIGGGHGNVIQSSSFYGFIGGGQNNTNGHLSVGAVIPGGRENFANGMLSFAAGTRAKAVSDGTFVWADYTESDFASTANNQFLIRAGGGVGIGTNRPQSALHVAGTVTANQFAGSGAGLTSLSGAALADDSVTAAKIAPGAVNHLDAADGSTVGAVQVGTNGLVGIGANNPQAGLEIAASGTVFAPRVLSVVTDNAGGFTNLAIPQALAVSGNLVGVLAEGWKGGGALTLVDVSDPQNPSLRCQVEQGELGFTNMDEPYNQSMAMAGPLLAIGAFSPARVTLADVSDPVHPAPASAITNGVGGWNDLDGISCLCLSGKLLAISSLFGNAVTLADVSDPAHPVQRAVLRLSPRHLFPGNLMQPIALNGALLAIATSNSVQLVDVSDSAHPILRSELVNGQGPYTNMFANSTLALDGGLLAIGSQAAVTIVDVSHPSAPVWIACLEEDKKNLFGLVGGSALAMAGHRLVDCYDTLVLFDLIDPSHPRRLGVAEQGVGGVNSLLAPDAVAFTGTNVVVLDWDTSSLTILGFSPAPAGLVSQGWVGIGVETPMAPLHVVGNVLVEQASCFNVLADHSSFGKDNIVTGTDAFAAGRMNTAGGEDSVAMGFDAQAVGRTSIALGTQVSATGYAAVALGGDATASGNAAVAMGSSTTASGFASVAMGDQTHANGEACLAMGTQTTASGTNTLSVGENAYADGFDSVALGMGATASGAAAFAMGDHTEAFGSNSMAMGKGAVAYHDHTFVWADDSYPYFNGVVFPFTSTGTNQFLIHASGGVGINTAYPNGAALNVNGAVVATAFVGSQELTLDTTNYQPLVLRVNGTRALRIEGSKDNSQHQGVVNLVGGSPINLVDPNVMGATIAGGGAANWMGDTGSNRVSANFGAIGGGLGNTIDTNADFACISGGELCTIHQGASNAAIGGGWDNLVETNALYATIAGGFGNWIWPNSSSATIAGGEDNQVLSGSIGASVGGGVDNRIAGGARFGALSGGTSNLVSGAGAFLGGGGYDGTSIQGNTASGAGAVMGGGTANLASGSRSAVVGGHNNAATNWYATVPGGAWNTAGGQGSFAAGRAARALDDGSFVWNCDWMNALASTGANQFLARASGGFSFYTGASGGATLAAGSGSWTSMSDRNAKDNFAPVDPRAVLEKVTELPLSIWNYKAQDPAIRHLGPMAQDFKAAFGLGETDTGITGVDADGVALAAIQGLNQKLESQQEQLRAKDARIQTLEQRIERLESLLNKTAEPSTGGNQ